MSGDLLTFHRAVADADGATEVAANLRDFLTSPRRELTGDEFT
ncbi:hypothetical protein [Actinoplanes sp. NPDC048796]